MTLATDDLVLLFLWLHSASAWERDLVSMKVNAGVINLKYLIIGFILQNVSLRNVSKKYNEWAISKDLLYCSE